jgi:diguanylate cyclase (GGDEF)-like protein
MSNQTEHRSKIEVETLLNALDKGGEAISKRMSYLNFDQADIEVLAGLGGRLQQYRQHFDELLFAHMQASPHLVDLLQSANDERIKIVQASYAATMDDSPHDVDHLRNRVHVGMVLQDLGLEPEWYLGIYRKYLEALLPILWEISDKDFLRFSTHVNALTKIIFFDIGVALDSYFLAAQKEQQRMREEALRKTEAAGPAPMRDELTGLPTRTLLADRMQQALAQADRDGKPLALLHLGLDHFRLINDAAGYAAGDQILKTIGERLQKSVREEDTLSYHGADEFVIMLRGMEETRHVAAICDKISEAISSPYEVNGKDYHVT